MPGVTDVARAKEIIGQTAILEFKLVEAGPAPKEDLLKQYNGKLPGDMEILPGSGAEGRRRVLRRQEDRAGDRAGPARRASRGSTRTTSRPCIFELKSAGAHEVRQALGREHRPLPGDHPRQAGRLGAEARRAHHRLRAGSAAASRSESANDLSLTLRSGALPASLTYLEEQVVGPSPRRRLDPRRRHRVARRAAADHACSCSVYYKLSGLNAIIALVFNLIILLGLMAYIGATMTLPGIAGFVLTMGMGVDSNVLIFERIKEELAAQRGVRAAINAGFSRVFLTLLDTHVASLIAAAFLFQFGTGPIRGFATTLSIGLLRQPVHVDLRVEDAVRTRALASARRRRSASRTLP